MGRAAVHTEDSLLDAALGLFAEGGVRLVTMAAVARAAGAPSGSVYHRFADQRSLHAALWRRTASRFEDGYAEQVGVDPDAATAIAASVWVVEWCRARPLEATLLHAGPRALGLGESDGGGAAHVEHRRDLARSMRRTVTSVADATGRPSDEVAFAMFDLPLAVVRGHLDAGKPVPAAAGDRVRRLVTRLLLG